MRAKSQTDTIRIHLGYFEQSPQALLFRWYHQSLDVFEQLNPAAPTVHAAFEERLLNQLATPNSPEADTLVREAHALSLTTQAALHQGRDRLLELNSCRVTEAQRLVERVREHDEDSRLWPYLERVFDAYGVSIEEHSELCHILRPGEHLRMQFPELPDDGVTVTLDRAAGLAREDILFLTWEHPMVRGAMDIILNSEHGNAALSILRHPDLDPGQLLIECFHVVECSAPGRLHISRFFPPVLIRSLFDADGNDLSHLPLESFETLPRRFDREHALDLLRTQRKLIEHGIRLADQGAQRRVSGLIDAGVGRMLGTMTLELKRLAALRKVNPNVRQEELDQLKANALEMHQCIQAGQHRLDAVRVIVTA